MKDNMKNKHPFRGFDPVDMESLSTEEQLVIRLHKAHYGLRHNAESRGGQGRILSLLLKRGGISQRELMDIVSVRAGSLSEVLGKLEDSGYISRSPNEEDRRRVDIVLTPEGEAAAREADERRSAGRRAFFSPLSEEEKAQLNGLLDKLSENIEWPGDSERRRRYNCGTHGSGGYGYEGRRHEGYGHGHGGRGHHHIHHHYYQGQPYGQPYGHHRWKRKKYEG